MNKQLLLPVIPNRAYKYVVKDFDPIEQNKIAEIIFSNATSSDYLYLSERFSSFEKVQNALLNCNIEKNFDDNFFIELRKLLLVEQDLYPPSSIRKLYKDDSNIAVFVGAGVSSLLGLKNWNELATELVNKLSREGKLSFAQRVFLKKNFTNPRDLISACLEQIEENERPRLLEESLYKNYEGEIYLNPYISLCELDCVKVTTNIDREFAKAYLEVKKKREEKEEQSVNESLIRPETLRIGDRKTLENDFKNVVVTKEELADSNDFYKDKIYHIHGFLDAPKSWVMSTREYSKAYHGMDFPLCNFLKDLFSNFTVIFVGSSVSELQILENVVGDIDSNNPKHFVLVDTFFYESSNFKFIKSHFKNLNTMPIPYYKDRDGYGRLITVLHNWAKELNELKNRSFIEERLILDEALKNEQ